MKLSFPDVELLDCDLIRGGTDAIVAMLPQTPGVYAWYKKFLPPDPESSDAEMYFNFIISETKLPHCLERDARLNPNFHVYLRSERDFPQGKHAKLRSNCAHVDFRRFLHSLLQKNGLLFQQALYVGKADILANRIEDHLEGRSELRKRLKEASIEISRCQLAYIEVPTLPGEGTGINLVVEDILSRLFYPPFTERYG
jgi:hypothetical protein